MSLMNTFVNEPENLAVNMDLIRDADRPVKFDKEFLISLGIDDSNAVLYKNLFISLGFVDQSGKPNTDYGHFIGTREESRSILAEKIWDKYTSLFTEERHIHEKNKSEITEVFRKVYGKDHSESFINLLSSTFKALIDYADIKSVKKQPVEMVSETVHLNGNGVSNGLNSESDETNADTRDLYKFNEKITDELKADESQSDKSVEYLMDLITRKPNKQESKNIETENEDSTMNNDIIEKTPDNKTLNQNETSGNFLDKALFKRAELLQKLDRKEEAIQALDQVIQYLETQYSGSGKQGKISDSLIQKAELLEKLGNDEKTLEAYEQYINRFYNQKK